MELEAKTILTKVGLPVHVALLLELYGIRTLSDLSSLDSTIIEDVENCVKNGTFEAIVDLEDKSNRLKFLGFDYKSLTSFKFQPMDLRKLLKVSGLAQKELEKLTKEIEKITSPVVSKKISPKKDKSAAKKPSKQAKLTDDNKPKKIKEEPTQDEVAEEKHPEEIKLRESKKAAVIITDFSRKEIITNKLFFSVSEYMQSVQLDHYLDASNFHVEFIKKGTSLTGFYF